MKMNTTHKQSNALRIAVASAFAGAMTIGATGVLAGACPADKIVADGQGQKPGPTAPKDVTDMVRASTDLAKEPAMIISVDLFPVEMKMDQHIM